MEIHRGTNSKIRNGSVEQPVNSVLAEKIGCTALYEHIGKSILLAGKLRK